MAGILDRYLEWCQKHRERRTYEWYRDHLQSFLDTLPDPATLPVADLKPFHVVEWVDRHTAWSPGYRRGAIVAVQRPFNWAQELGYIPASPIRRIAKPQPARRDNPMTPADFDRLLALVPEGDVFRDFLLFAWHSGARPQEIRHLEARHVLLPAECIVLPKEEAKGKRRPRTIIVQGPALEIARRLVARHPAGKLFRNADGAPWKKAAICNRFDRLMLAHGRQTMREQGIAVPKLPRFDRRRYPDKAALKVAQAAHRQAVIARRKEIVKLARERGKTMAAYDARHGFTQRLLENGANHLAVAELLGHANGQMVSTVYSHMNRATAHLKETLRKGEAASDGA